MWLVATAAFDSTSGQTRRPPPEVTSQRTNAGQSQAQGARDGQPQVPDGYVQVTDNSPVGWKLAAVDEDSKTLERNRIRRYEYYLDQLEPKCTQTRQKIADVALRAVQVLEEERGVEMKAYQMLQHMDDAVPREAGPLDCPGVAALLATATEPR